LTPLSGFDLLIFNAGFFESWTRQENRGSVMRVRNLVFLIPVLTLLLLTACGGGSSSSNSSFNNANLNGTFFTASLDQSGGIIGEFGDSTYDGKGNGTYTGTYSSSSGAYQAESDSGTYSVSANGSVTLTGTSGGLTNCGLSADTNTAVCSTVSATTYQNVAVMVKAGSGGYSSASLNGTYYMAEGDTKSGFNSQFGTATFNGQGTFTATGTLNNATAANQSSSSSGTYSVNANGSFTITPSGGSAMQCGMSADTKTLVCATVSNTADQNIIVMVLVP